MIKLKGNLSKKTLDALKKKGVKVKLAGELESKKKVDEKSHSGATQGRVRVISFDRIVLSRKWTGKLGLKQGDELGIKFENGSLLLKK